MNGPVYGKVGSKGELFLPKRIRTRLQINPGDKVMFTEEENSLRVMKVSPVTEGFKRKKFTKITFEEFEDMTSEILGEEGD